MRNTRHFPFSFSSPLVRIFQSTTYIIHWRVNIISNNRSLLFFWHDTSFYFLSFFFASCRKNEKNGDICAQIGNSFFEGWTDGWEEHTSSLVSILFDYAMVSVILDLCLDQFCFSFRLWIAMERKNIERRCEKYSPFVFPNKSFFTPMIEVWTKSKVYTR